VENSHISPFSNDTVSCIADPVCLAPHPLHGTVALASEAVATPSVLTTLRRLQYPGLLSYHLGHLSCISRPFGRTHVLEIEQATLGALLPHTLLSGTVPYSSPQLGVLYKVCNWVSCGLDLKRRGKDVLLLPCALSKNSFRCQSRCYSLVHSLGVT
jgi:hypothetical protein